MGNANETLRSEEREEVKKESTGNSASEEAYKKTRAELLKEKQAEAKKQAHKVNVQRNLRNIQQCLLCENLDLAKNYHQQNEEFFAYQIIRQVAGSSNQIINDLKGVSGLEDFLCIRTAVLSLLQPKIRIYKVTYPKNTISISKEIIFADTFGAEAATSTHKYLAAETKDPNWRNVGLKGFSLKHTGKSHGAIEQNIQCTLDLYCKTLKDFVAQAPGADARYVDLLLFPEAKIDRDTQQYNPKHYEIKVALGYEVPSDQAIMGLNPTAEELSFLRNLDKWNIVVALTLYKYDFNIKETGEVDIKIDYFGRMDTVMSSKPAMSPGSIIVDSQGNVQGSPDRQTGLDYSSFSRIKAELGSLIKFKQNPDLATKNTIDVTSKLLKDEAFRRLYNKAYELAIDSEFNISDVEQAITNLTSKDGAPIMAKTLRDLSGGLKSAGYKVFMKQLLEGNDVSPGTGSKGGGKAAEPPGSRLFAMSVSKEHMDSALGIVTAKPQGSPDAAKKKEMEKATASAIGLAAKSVRVGRPKDIATLQQTPAVKEIISAENLASIEDESSSKDKKAGSAEADQIKKYEDAVKASIITSKALGDSYEFYYLYLGDIIELALKNSGFYGFLKEPSPPYRKKSYIADETGKDYNMTNMRFLLGPLEYLDKEGKIKSINLAEFPLSFDLFRNWFVNSIVKENNSNININTFLNKLINQLVLPALGGDCLRPTKLRNTRFQNIHMSLPGNTIDVGGNKFQVESLPMQRKINIDGAAFQGSYVKNARNPRPLGVMAKNTYDYRLTQVNSIKSITSRNGNCIEDMKDNIYHFNIGNDRGLLKEMSFSKDDIPGLAELRSLQNIESGNDQLSQLSFPYDCTLKLVGNTLFIPGMIFYANPSFLGLGRPEDTNSIAHQLNLGGYFLILETELVIRPGFFETTVVGKTIGHGKVKAN